MIQIYTKLAEISIRAYLNFRDKDSSGYSNLKKKLYKKIEKIKI